MHRLLQRQVKRHLGSISALETLPEEVKALLAAVDQAYVQADDDRNMIERSADLMSQELNQANQQLRSSIPDLFLRLALDGTIVDYQAGCLGEGGHSYLAGLNPRGANLWQQLPGQAVERLQAAIARARQEGTAVAVEHALIRNGHVAFYEARVLRVVDGQAIVIIRNITERKQAESALRASEQQLRQRSQELQSAITALQKAQAQLVQQEKMSSLGQLVAGIAHEINNPLSFILGNLSHLDDYVSQLMELIDLYQAAYPEPEPKIIDKVEEIDLSFLTDDVPKLLKSARNGVDRIASVIQALRTFSRLDEASFKIVNLHENLASMLTILQYRYAPNRPNIKVNYHPQDLPDIECFAGQINQVFLNLALNGFDAIEARLANDIQNFNHQSSQITRLTEDTFQGRRSKKIDPTDASFNDELLDDPSNDQQATYQASYQANDQKLKSSKPQNRITTSEGAIDQSALSGPESAIGCLEITTRYDEVNDRVVIRFIDDGIGISQDVRDRIFDPFFTTKPIGQGTGMGLAVVHQVVIDHHGGQLHYLPRPGGGSIFEIALPVRLAKDVINPPSCNLVATATPPAS